ncbi:alpha-amylase family protein [Reinekea marina]|uniref:Alpha-amylase family protein n=2 Tax=Reinekea marina TaxID=1310421 RepID=A0ABV7WWG4_9GAMM
MPDSQLSMHKLTSAYERILNSLTDRYQSEHSDDRWQAFRLHFKDSFPAFFNQLASLYDDQWDFYYFLERCSNIAARFWLDQPAFNRPHANWFESSDCVGASAYVDLFAENISGLENRIAYLEELGVTYLHLMPLFEVPAGDSDGGYAVKDFGQVNPELGTNEDLKRVKSLFIKSNIKLVLDFVFNHVSDQHQWAIKAKQGDERAKRLFWVFENKQDIEQYSTHLRDIFPDKRRGCFTYNAELHAEVWTTFNSYQWDLNYSNPDVFTLMSQELLKIVELGADVVRLDALAFTWKEPGTSCENLNKAHTLVKAFNAFLNMAAPSVVLKSEAIVAPDEVVKYISEDECSLSYNPNLMALLWEALATRQTQLLIEGTQHRTDLPSHTRWVNYLRCHDDIGWAFADHDAWQRGINPFDHRQFLNNFYTGKFEGSFAKGVPFQYNPENGDCRISGTLASLTGVDSNTNIDDLSVKRIIMLHGVIMAFKGVPLLYLGDELATLNDFSYSQHSDKANDSRWVHRVAFGEKNAKKRQLEGTLEHTVFNAIKQQIEIRAEHSVFGHGELNIEPLLHENLFIFHRSQELDRVIVVANFSEHSIQLTNEQRESLGITSCYRDLLGKKIFTTNVSTINPYDIYWLVNQHN